MCYCVIVVEKAYDSEDNHVLVRKTIWIRDLYIKEYEDDKIIMKHGYNKIIYESNITKMKLLYQS